MKLIIITWLPWTGKTSLWKKISEDFRIPMYSKDSFKEIIYDCIWKKDVIGNIKITQAAYQILYHILEQNFKSDKSIILESNFYKDFSEKVFLEFKNKYIFDILQIKCITEGKALFERFKNRSFSGERHSWHDDVNSIDHFKEIALKWDFDKLDIWWIFTEIDTTNFERINYWELYNKLDIFLNK